MKVIFTSVDAIFDLKNNLFFCEIEDTLNYFLDIDSDNKVIVMSMTLEKLEIVPDNFISLQVDGRERKYNIISKFLSSNTKYSRSDIVILGANDADLQLASNEKTLLLSAFYALSNNPKSRIYEYGIKIKAAESLRIFFDRFSDLKEPWNYRLKIDDFATIYSLTNAETKTARVNADMAYLNNRFKACLKDGHLQYRALFAIYFLVSSYSAEIIEEFAEVKFWGVYPSSSIGLNLDLQYFKELIRKLFNGLPKVPNEEKQILERIYHAPKRQYIDHGTRIENGCTDELNSIRVNPWFKEKLIGSTVCIIDDFTTIGSSCETARILLKQAGVKKLIFVTMGKFGDNYFKYEYDTNGNIYQRVYSSQLSYEKIVTGKVNPNANFEFVKSLRPLL